MPDQPAYSVTIATLAAQIPAAVVVTPQGVAFYNNSIPEEQARKDGAGIESVAVLDDVLQVGAVAAGPVVAGKVGGYGPMRLRYFLDRAADLASKVTELDTSHVHASGTGTAKKVSLVATRALRDRATRVLKNLAGRREEEKSRLKKARKGTEKADERVRSLEALAKELAEQMAKVPPEVAADAGATTALVDDLLAASKGVLSSQSDAKGDRNAIAALYDEMNVLDGRLMHEIQLLVGAMRDARKLDKSVPAVQSDLFRSGKKKAKKDAAAPEGGSPPAGNG